jgi:hypoxia up-regulated 1
MMAMVLAHAREIASTYAEGPIVDAVIAVPSTWGQAERLSVAQAAELGGIKLHQLMNDNSAVALHYGVFHRKEIESKPMNIMFFDMGASTTTCTIAQYQVIKGKTENAPQISIKGVGNAPVGGLKIDLSIRDMLVDKWEATKKTSTDIRTQKSGRALAKLLVSANKVKTVLSANKETRAQVENLVDDEDFKAPVTREEMEATIQEDIVLAMNTVKEAFKTSGITQDEIKKVIMFGGGQRVPAIQDALRKELGGKLDLSFSINSDEAAALGGSYQAAYVTKLFRVKTIWVRDGALEPIEVRFEREVDPEENDGKPIKEVKRTLFQVMNPYPQKKAITFNRFQDDFNFTVHIGNKMAQKAELKGIKAAIDEYSDSESKGVKAHFRMDESGIIRLESAEATFQKEVMEEVPKKEEKKDSKDAPDFDKGTLDAIKDKFKDFFNGDASNEEEAKKVLEELSKAQKNNDKASEEETEDEKTKSEESEESSETTEEAKSEEPTEDKTEETSEDDTKKADETDQTDEDKMRDEWGADEIEKEAAKEAEEEAKAAEEKKEAEKPKPVLKTFSKPLEYEHESFHTGVIGGEEKEQVYQQLKKLDEVEAEQKLLESSQNELEGFIYDMQDKLFLDGWTEMLTEDKRDELSAVMSEASDWIWDVEEPTAIVYQDKLAELKKATKEWRKRVEEYQRRPEIIENLQKLIKASKTLIFDDFKNKTGEGLALSQDDIHTISEKIEKTEDWLTEELEKQNEKPLHEEPSLKVSDMEMKGRILSKAVDDLAKKVRLWRPPKPTKPPKTIVKTDEVDEKKEGGDDAEKPSEDSEKSEEEKVEETNEETTEQKTDDSAGSS